jgi:GTP-binding protein
MIDTARLNIKAGNGGNGCCSFLREKFKPKGGPNGGDGGNGGNAYICGDPSLNTLRHIKFNSTVYVAGGAHGKGKKQRGFNGHDTIVMVPIGTEVSHLHRDGEKELLFDVVGTEPQLVARGGKGGFGNAHYVSATNQEPMLFERGEKGEYMVLFLELKLVADVGLIACPNAGKSTLISKCTAAEPRVAGYPFTTVEPVLGVVSNRGVDFVMMEIPGLLEGAHKGVGLGHQFLRHAERVRVYVHLVDGLSKDPVSDFEMVSAELRQFNPSMVEKPLIVALNKLDVTEVRENQADVLAGLVKATRALPTTGSNGEQVPVVSISAATGEGVDSLLSRVVEVLSTVPRTGLAPVGIHEPVRRAARPNGREVVYKEAGVYVVESEHLERLAALADTRDRRVILQLWREMRRRGLARQLTDAGIEAGDTIRVGKVEVAWF